MAEDPFFGLHAVDFAFEWAEASLTPMQMLILLSGMYEGERPPDAVLKVLTKKWRKVRMQKKAVKVEMGIRWEPTIEVTGIESLVFRVESLEGFDISAATSAQLFVSPFRSTSSPLNSLLILIIGQYIAAKVVTPAIATEEDVERAQKELLARSVARSLASIRQILIWDKIAVATVDLLHRQ